MGNAQSNANLHHRLGEVLPTVSEGKKWDVCDKAHKPFLNDRDRDQFVQAAVTVITQNGALLLGEHRVRLLYSRRENERFVARLVAEKDGVITTKVEPVGDGRDQAEAFMALKREVEVRLEGILEGVPGEGGVASPVVAGSSSVGSRGQQVFGSERRAMAPPPPPTVSGEGEGERMMTRNEGPPAYGVAVREWRDGAGGEKKG